MKRAAGVAPAATSGTPKWVIPAAAAAVVLVVIIVAVVMMGRNTAPATATAGNGAGPAATNGAAVKPPDPTPATLDATVKVASEPTGAAIVLDGRDIKQSTPSSIAVRGAGPHTIKLSKRGFVAKEFTLADADVRSGSVSFTLEQAQVVIVPIAISSAYPVEVFEGSKSISRPSNSHQLKLPAGTTIRVRAPEYLLDAAVRVDGKTDYQAPALGYLTVLTRYETCNVKIGAKDLGFPPITKLPLVVGQYKIDVVCPAGQSPNGQFITIAPNVTATARIQ